MSTAVSKSASAKTMFGLLPPSSRATFFMLPAAPRSRARPASMPPVSEMRSTSGLSASAWPTRPPGPRTRLTTPAGDAGLLEQPGQVDRGQRRDRRRLHDRGVAGRERRRDLPRQLEQRVVPRRDERADADRLVDDPRPDGRVVLGRRVRVVVLGREVGVVAEARGRRRRCPSGSRAWPCRSGASPRGPSPRGRDRSARRPGQERGALGGRSCAASRRCRRRGARPRWRPGPGRRSRRPPRSTIVPSDGLITGLHVRSPEATHAPSMNRSGNGSLTRSSR